VRPSLGLSLDRSAADLNDSNPFLCSQVSAMPTFLILKGGKVVESLKGADPGGLTRMVKKHAGSPPFAPLPEKAEEAKTAGNVRPSLSAFSSSTAP
jgi:thioredoxin-like negative regulator of GroEL